MAVYANRHRSIAAPKRASETVAEFYDRIAGSYWDQVREVINAWWTRFPAHAQQALRSRLLDRNSDANVYSAMWELYLHEMLLGSGCTVEVEPNIGTRGKNPDFVATLDGQSFVVEAIWRSERIDSSAHGPLASQLMDAIESVPSPNFVLAVSINRAGVTAPPQKRLKIELATWLASLDPDVALADQEKGRRRFPRHTWLEADWSISFEAIPRSPGKRGARSNRTIGFYPALTYIGGRSESVLDAVKKKGSRYGTLVHPFIVAVGNSALFPDDEDVETSLYGSSVEYAHTAAAPTFGRQKDGYWHSSRERQHSHVSGVLVVDNPSPGTWARAVPTLWRNPDPSHHHSPVLPTWAIAQLIGVAVDHQPAAAPPYTALGLDEGWPTGEAFPR
ncbi:hypothetical protein [Amycolatopsis kentuckyensis]|uniref:hypothetical protein n=1 Tax=Amycolatopsis kentuckyensis TaxID=218823 RepID=UPI00356B08A5